MEMPPLTMAAAAPREATLRIRHWRRRRHAVIFDTDVTTPLIAALSRRV